MTLRTYVQFTDETAIYPEAGRGTLPALAYACLGLAGECGEIANKTKKLMRDIDTPAARMAISKELGDVLFYWARVVKELGLDPVDIACENMEKLRGRKARGTIKGSGDER